VLENSDPELLSSSAFENCISTGAGGEAPKFSVIGSMGSNPPISTSARPPKEGCEEGGGAEKLEEEF
jgi:hypothetical protein